MKSEIIIDILIPKHECDFLVIKTNRNYFEMRMGGYNVLEKLDEIRYKSFDQPTWLHKTVKQVLTDNHILYIENEGKDGFSYGFTFINNNGETCLALDYHNIEEFQQLIENINPDDDFYEI